MSIDLNVRDGETVSLDVSGGAARRTEENIEDIVGALVTGGTNVTATYDDGAGTLTIDTSALNEEEVEDAVAALLSAGNAITLTYNDASDTLTVAVDESALSFYDGANLTADVDNSSTTTDELDVAEGSAKIYQSSAQTISTGSVTQLSFGNEGADFTPGDALTVDLANDRITVNKPGIYLVSLLAGINNIGDGARVQTRVTVGGTNNAVTDNQSGAAGDDLGGATPALVSVTTTPTDLRGFIFHSHGGDRDTIGSEPTVSLRVVKIQ